VTGRRKRREGRQMRMKMRKLLFSNSLMMRKIVLKETSLRP